MDHIPVSTPTHLNGYPLNFVWLVHSYTCEFWRGLSWWLLVSRLGRFRKPVLALVVMRRLPHLYRTLRDEYYTVVENEYQKYQLVCHVVFNSEPVFVFSF
jgi:hypothetical protein